jgi:polyisoprenoid-binding protein YceI
MLRRSWLALVTLVSVAAPVAAQSTTWTIDPNHTAAQFAVKHLMVSTVRGQFEKLQGTVQWDGKDVSKVAIDVTIEAASVNTRVDKRDEDLRSANFLEVEKHPTITFKSTKSEPAGQGKFKVTGDLTIHGVTKSVVLDVEGPSPPLTDRGTVRVGATAHTKINRKEFGLMYNRLIEAGGVVVGDDVDITIDLEMTRPAGTD